MGNHTRWPHDETLHAWWVVPGRPLAGEYPGARTPGKAAKKLQLLIDAGIDSIVDLTTSQDPLEPYREQLRALAEKVGQEVRHFSYPIPDMGVIDQAAYDPILTCIRDEIDCGRVVYLYWGAAKAARARWSAACSSTAGWTTSLRSLASPNYDQGPARPRRRARSRRHSTGCFESARHGAGRVESD
jgi:hypothetical protein